MRTLSICCEHWPLRQAFAIARGSKTEAVTVLVCISENGHTGRGECVPYTHYGETVKRVMSEIETLRDFVEQGGERIELQSKISAGAARNAIDCALWDLESKQLQQRAWTLAGTIPPTAVTCTYTLSLDTPENMGRAARLYGDKPLLKVKLGLEQPLACIEAIRKQAPDPKLIIDANESWNLQLLCDLMQTLHDLGVSLLEQPLPAGEDEDLAKLKHTIAIAADESCHTCDDLAKITKRYDVINIKLDKCGGLTEALRLRKLAMELNLGIMIGCMVGTSLAMAPAMLVTPGAEVVDLDGPLLLSTDRDHGLVYSEHRITPPTSALWG